jgi:OTU domain-containing protein 6
MTNPQTDELLTDEEFETYCSAIRNTKAWGGEIEIKALSSRLQLQIEVIQAIGSPYVHGDGFRGNKLIITYHRHLYSLGEHYNSTKDYVDEPEMEEEAETKS